MMTEYFEHPVRAVIADSITVEIQGSQPGVVVLEDGTEIVVPPGKKITFWKQQVLEGVRAGHIPAPIDLQDVYDEMTAEMKAAALEGFNENPVAQYYAQAMPHSLAVGDTLTIDEPKPPPPPDPLDAERVGVTPHLRDYWTKGPGSTTPRWPEQDRSTTMYDADRQNRAYESTEPTPEDLLAPLDVAVAELDDAMERLEHTLAPLLRGQGMSLTTEAITADKIGPDPRSEVRRRVAANVARISRVTTGVRDLRERIDL